MSRIAIDELAAGAGISRPSFYFYFDSKVGVLTALLDEIAGQMAADTGDWLAGSGADDESLRRSLRTSARLWREHGPLLRQALVEEDPDPALRAFRERILDGFVVKAAERIQRDRDAGFAPPGPSPEALARALVQMKFTVLSSASADDVVDTLVTIMQRAIYGTCG
ncbi:MAG: putative TetR-family transcriptional regulator [Actinoallomurus sp.]|nr:putative TetR-family transcriptional regulator [Actinoallomurus sp.]